jgi:predicted DNA-binding protein
MTLHLPIDSETEARLRRLAEQAGKDLTAYVSEVIERAVYAQITKGAHSVAEFDKALDELFAGDTRKLPAVPLTYTREDIYLDHD